MQVVARREASVMTRLFVVVLLCAASSTAVATRSLYDVLGVAKDSGEDEIRRAYRKMSLIYHPDKNSDPGAKDKFMEIAQAYEVLSDKARREAYDRTGRSSSMRGAQGHGGGMSEEEALRMFSSFMDQFEELISSSEAISDLVDGLWGSKARAKQGWVEWGVKAAMKRAAKSVGGFIVDGIKTGDIEVNAGGAKMDYNKGGGRSKQQGEKGSSIGDAWKKAKAKAKLESAKAKREKSRSSEEL